MSGTPVSSVSNSTTHNTRPNSPIWQNHSFAATAVTTFKKLAGSNQIQQTILTDRQTQFANQQQAPNQYEKETKAIITELESDDLKALENALKNNTISLEQSLGIIDGALRSDIKPKTKKALLNLLNDVLSEKKPLNEQIADYINQMISDKEKGWPDDVCTQAIKTFYQEGSQLTTNINNQFNTTDDFAFQGKPETLSLLQAIINSSKEIPEWALDLLIGAANITVTTCAGDIKTTGNKLPDWLPEVMRGIKPEAFQKIAEKIVNCDDAIFAGHLPVQDTSDNGEVLQLLFGEKKYITEKLETITTLSLAALPEDDNAINKNCMPFTALEALLSIKNDTPELNGSNIVASIGEALVDADCNNTTWTNTRTTVFLKSLNKIKPTEMAKDALLLCRSQLKNNAYKFDVAIQYVADDESEQKHAQDQKESSSQNPTPITSFFVDCFSNVNNRKYKYTSITSCITSFQAHTGEPLYQFKPQTYNRIKDAMVMDYARKAFDAAKTNTNSANGANNGSSSSSSSVNDPAYDFNTWYDRNKKTIFEHLTSESSSNGPIDIDSITLDRSSFQDQLQYVGEIDKSRYNTLSDDKIVNKMQEILNLAASNELATTLNTNPNIFPSMYVLEHVCTLLDNTEKRAQMLKESKKTIQNDNRPETALKTILEYYYGDRAPQNDVQQPQQITNFIKELQRNISIHQLKLERTAAGRLFTEFRTLTTTSGENFNCLFDAINKQKPSEEEEKYNIKALREHYVEIQKAGKEISPEIEQRLKEEQADISCLPQMATYLERPIVVLTEQSDDNQGENGIQIALPKGHQNQEIQLPPIRLENLEHITIKDWIVAPHDSTNHDAEFTALTEALKVTTNNANFSVDNVKKLNVQDVLKQLLGNNNTIALHFKGSATSGHYQSFVPKNKAE